MFFGGRGWNAEIDFKWIDLEEKDQRTLGEVTGRSAEGGMDYKGSYFAEAVIGRS